MLFLKRERRKDLKKMGGGLTRELCFFVFVVVVFITEGILELFVCFFRVKKRRTFFLKLKNSR